jgi:hypothetical protein
MFHPCFPDTCCNCVYLDVACVLFACCVMVTMNFSCVSGVFSSVLEACFKCFNCLQTYVATVVFGCFKSRSGVASLVLSPSAASSLSEPTEHPYDTAAGFFRIGGVIRPYPLVAQATRALRVAQNGAQRCTAQQGRGEGLAEGARLRWQRGGGDGGVEEIGRGGTRACMLVLFSKVRPDASSRRTSER